MANQVRTIFKNMSWLTISQLITSVCAFIWTILTARYLGVSDYGILGFAISISSLFAVFQDMGIQTHIVRSIAANNDLARKYLGNAFTLRIIFSILYLLFICLLLFILNSSQVTFVITMLFAFECVLINTIGLFNGSFQAFEKTQFQAISTILINVFTLLFILASIYFDKGLLGVAISYILANAIAIVYSFLMHRKHIVKFNLSFDYNFCIKLIKWGIPFVISTVCYTIYYQIDMVMLTQLVGDYANGIYNATYKLINVLTLFYSIYTAVVFPVMSKLYVSKKDLLKLSFEKSIKYLLLVSIPLSLGMCLYSTDIIVLVYGNQYIDADKVLQILIWTVSFLFINGACTISLNASHLEVSVTKIYVLAAILNIILNFILIPHYSYIGASVATVISDIFICILCIYTLNKIDYLPNKKFILDILKIIISSLIMGAFLYYLHISLVLAIPLGIVIYLVLIYVIKLLDADDKNIIHQIIGK